MTDADKEQFDGELIKMGNLYERRNTLAHQYFKPAAAGDGVIFSIVHIKGGAAPLETPWTKKDFDDLDTLWGDADNSYALKECPYRWNIRASTTRSHQLD